MNWILAISCLVIFFSFMGFIIYMGKKEANRQMNSKKKKKLDRYSNMRNY